MSTKCYKFVFLMNTSHHFSLLTYIVEAEFFVFIDKRYFNVSLQNGYLISLISNVAFSHDPWEHTVTHTRCIYAYLSGSW